MFETLAVILAGGKGARLEPLTRDRAKPAVPFGGNYRIIDFTLSNCLNSRVSQVLVLTQYKALSLGRHIDRSWRQYFRPDLGEFIDVVPPQQRIDEHWYQGTADAVYQNIYALERAGARYVLILAGDHIYKMNYARLLAQHQARGADVTIAALTVARTAARNFGVLQVAADQRLVGFREKPADPQPLPDAPEQCLASMGIYLFETQFLCECLCRDANDPHSGKDFGHDVIPALVRSHRVFAAPFDDLLPPGQPAYWRDVGTLDAYYQANMDLVRVAPELNLYELAWPIRADQTNRPPSKFVFGSGGDTSRTGRALDSLVCPGCIVSGGLVERSILSPNVRVHSYAHVQDSILFDGVEIGRQARVRRAILDKGVIVPPGLEIGWDLARDRDRGFTVSDDGVVVVAKGDRLADFAAEQVARPTG